MEGYDSTVSWILGAFAKQIVTASLITSVHLSPRETARIPPDGFLWNFVFGIFTEICRLILILV
jgi:hypothetical protein